MHRRLTFIFLFILLAFTGVPATIVTAEPLVPHSPQHQSFQPTSCKSETPDKESDCLDTIAGEELSPITVYGSPIRFTVYDDTSTAVFYNGQQQFYGQRAEGVFIQVAGQVYGPGRVPAGQTTYAYTQLSNTSTGTGTAANPWKVITTAQIGNTGLRLQQEVSYINGTSFMTYLWRVTNTGTNTIPYTLFHAADLYTDFNDYGYGYYDSSTGAIGGYNSNLTFYQYFQPIVPATHFYEGFYADVWERIGSIGGPGAGFNDTYRPTDYIDNGAGLQWNRVLAAGSTDIISDYGVFNTQIGGIICHTLDVEAEPTRGTVQILTPENCPDGPGYTVNTVVQLRAHAGQGYTFSHWRGDAVGTSLMVNVVMNRNKSVEATFASQRPVVVLVHGFHGKFLDPAEYDACPADVAPYLMTAADLPHENWPDFYDFGVFARNLMDDGYEVWVARVETGSSGTPVIEANALCLRQQLEQIPASSGKVTLIAHSMGGLVSRAYVENSSLYDDNVSQLITLGTPHVGTPLGTMYCALGNEQYAACQFDPLGIIFVNDRYSERNSEVTYNFIAGDKTPFGALASVLLVMGQGDNDGVVGAESALGRIDPPLLPPVTIVGGATRHEINASHSTLEFGFWEECRRIPLTNVVFCIRIGVGATRWFASYFQNDFGEYTTPTASYNCVLRLMDEDRGLPNPRGSCPPESITPDSQAGDEAIVSALPSFTNAISSGQMLTYTVAVDGDTYSEFSVMWGNGDVEFTLVNPNGVPINPAYAASHPDEVVYEANTNPALQLYATYRFTTTVPGFYTLVIDAGDVGADTEFITFGAVRSTRVLTLEQNAAPALVGSTRAITAVLSNGTVGIPTATVRAYITRSSGSVDSVLMSHQGNGVYRGNYTAPNNPGYLPLRVVAEGTDGGIAFAREVQSLFIIAAPTIALSGNYSDVPRDDDANGKYEKLDVNVGLTVNQAGNYLVSGDLMVGNTVIAHGVTSATLGVGNQTATLPFDGDQVRVGREDGPFVLTNLTVSSQQNGSIPVVWQAQQVATTGVYFWEDFAATCYELATIVNGDGALIIEPLANCNGGQQYTSDSVVTLEAVAPNGTFTGWGGDVTGDQNPISLALDEDREVIANFGASRSLYLPHIRR